MTFPRYPKYKDSGVEWLGEVPEEWDVAPLKRNLSINNGKDHKHVEQEAGYPVYGSGGVFAWAGEYLYEGEAVLLGRKGTIDKPLYVNEKFWTVDTMFYAIANKNANSKYFYYVSTQIPFDLYSTNTALPSMTQSTLGSHIVAAPKIHEQSKIVVFLDQETAKIDALIAEQNKLVELLKEKRQGIISHAVTKGLNPKAKMKDSGVEWLGEVPEGWEVISLKHIVSIPITDGPHETPNFIDEGIPFVSAEAIGSGEINFNKIRGFISLETHEQYSTKCHPKKNDIFLIKSGATTGVSAIVETDIDFNIWSPLALIRCDKTKASPYFVLNAIRSKNFQEAITLNWSFGTQQNIGMGVIENLSIALPPLSEQIDIIKWLDPMLEKTRLLIAEAYNAVELLKERRSALISAAVTGKIDVRKAS